MPSKSKNIYFSYQKTWKKSAKIIERQIMKQEEAKFNKKAKNMF